MTQESSVEIVEKMFVHSCHVRFKRGSAVVVKEKIKYSDGTIKPNITFVQNPKRSFYITKPKYQTYTLKPEFELMSRLDRHIVYDHELTFELAKALGIFSDGSYIKPARLFKSPYVFGADISIEALIKMSYLNQWPDSTLQPSVGFLDIETSIDTGQIILISYMHDNIVHTAILDSFLYDDDKKKNRVHISKAEITAYVKSNILEKAQSLKNDPKHTKRAEVIESLIYDIEVLDTELKLIAWIFKRIHESKIDFITIWNLHFDISHIIGSLKNNSVDPIVLFSSPDIPKELRYFNYRDDQKRDVDHFTLRWPWIFNTSGTQFVDAMGLYSQCRRTAGYLNSYTLDAVLDSEVGLGKIPLAEGSHVMMQRHHFRDYVVYNIFDVIGLRFLEDKNHDVLTMMLLSTTTPVSKFATATTKATNNMYYNLINKGMVYSAYSNEDSYTKLDKFFPSKGGAVLNVSRTRGCGIPLSI